MAIEQCKDTSILEIEELIGSSQWHEERMQRSIENLVQAFQSTIKIEAELATHFQSKRAQGESL